MTKRKPRHVAHDALKNLRMDMKDAMAPSAPLGLSDGFENFVANIGTPKDKAFSNSYSSGHFDPRTLEAMYRGSWIGRKIIDVPTDDMTREWREWQVDAALQHKILAAEEKIRLRDNVCEATRLGRLFGSSAIIVGCKQNLDKPTEPLDLDAIKPGDLTYLHVGFAPYLSIYEWEDDLNNPNFGQPRLYHYAPFYHRTGGSYVEIHASRVIPFVGARLPPFAALAGNAWGDPIFQAISDTVATASSITAVIASLVHEAKVDVFKVPDLPTFLATEAGERKLLQRFSIASQLKSINNAIILGGNEDYDQKQINFAGLSDIHLRIMQEVSGAADIPATRLLGQSPAGMTATGESDLRNYYDSINAKQKTELKPRLDLLDKIMLASEGIKLPAGATYRFRPLWQETPEQRGTIALQKANAAVAINGTGLISREVMSEALVSQIIADGVFPGMADAVREAKAAGKPILGEAPVAPPKEQPAPKPAPNNQADRKTVRDAAPRTLYVSRPVVNAAEILAWAKAQGFASTIAAADLHVTIAYSRDPVDWMTLGSESAQVEIPAGGPRLIEPLGNDGAIVLLFDSWELRWRWENLKERGASWDHPSYQPHITIQYGDHGIDLSKVEPYRGGIIFGPERFAELE